MKIENVTLETKILYKSDDNEVDVHYRKDIAIDILEIIVPLPGGCAIYEIPLLKGQKDSLEYAAKLAKEGK